MRAPRPHHLSQGRHGHGRRRPGAWGLSAEAFRGKWTTSSQVVFKKKYMQLTLEQLGVWGADPTKSKIQA